MFNVKRFSTALLLLAFVGSIGLIGCGSGSSNDQGVSFTLLGFFGGPLDGDDLPAGELGQFVPLSGGNFIDEGAPTSSGTVLTYLGMQNNMLGQFIRTDRVFMEYQVPGARVSVPSSSFPLGLIVGPAGGNNSTLPDSFTDEEASVGNLALAQFPIVPASVMEFINFNRTSFPEAPFEMNVRVVVTGITSAGDRLDSNESYYQVIFTPDRLVEPSEDEGGDVGSESSNSSEEESLEEEIF